MESRKPYFFCGIGGSGMLPLACILRARGHEVAGSDRSLDQERLGEKFEFLRRLGIALHPQDGSGLTRAEQVLVTSAAIEENRAGRHQGGGARLRAGDAAGAARRTVQRRRHRHRRRRHQRQVDDDGHDRLDLHTAGRAPTVMNGAVMKNFVSEETPFASALVGAAMSSSAKWTRATAPSRSTGRASPVLNNITLDHKSLDELRRLFRDFAAQAETVVLNLDDDETRLLAAALPRSGWSPIRSRTGAPTLPHRGLVEEPFAIAFDVTDRRSGECAAVRLQVPGRHNAANALAAIAAAQAAGVPLAEAAHAMEHFTGLRRRFELVGSANGVTVIDDFGHNPDKIEATLSTLHAFPGRLLVYFQPHGFGPLRIMRREMVDCFERNLGEDDVLILPTRSITAGRPTAPSAAATSRGTCAPPAAPPSTFRRATPAATAWRRLRAPETGS
jgi:UDP-N-acetylmuramate--alanine ligase